MFNIGFGELAIICIVLIIAVGPERLPSMMKTLGKTLRTLRQASRDIRASTGIDELMREDFDLYTPPAPRRPMAVPQMPPPQDPAHPAELPENAGTPLGHELSALPVPETSDATHGAGGADLTGASGFIQAVPTTTASPVHIPAEPKPISREDTLVAPVAPPAPPPPDPAAASSQQDPQKPRGE